MIITREIPTAGVTVQIELTPEEIRRASEIYDKENKINDIIQQMENSDYFSEVEFSEEQLRKIADIFENKLSKNDVYLESYWDSLDTILEQLEKGEINL